MTSAVLHFVPFSILFPLRNSSPGADDLGFDVCGFGVKGVGSAPSHYKIRTASDVTRPATGGLDLSQLHLEDARWPEPTGCTNPAELDRAVSGTT